jgi:hypothetical protein
MAFLESRITYIEATQLKRFRLQVCHILLTGMDVSSTRARYANVRRE